MAADVLLVIPAYREMHRLPPYLRELVATLSTAPFQTDILIVDDGSPRDEQQRLAAQVGPGTQGACRVLEPMLLDKNHGKGHSIILGWRSGGDSAWVGFVDADGATPAPEVRRLLLYATQNPGDPPACLWASRIRMLGRTTNRPLGRYLLGRVFANLAGSFIGLPVYDSQCGFKLVPRVHYRKIAPLLQEPRFCFDLELLLALHHVGAPVVEIPIDWRDVPGGHVHTIRDGFAMLRQIPVIQARAKSWPA